MSKIFILSCLCLVILYTNYVDAQNRLRTTARPARRPYRTPPARVLNKVQPKSRSRQQQMQIKLRQKNPQNHGRIKPAQVRAYQDEYCEQEPEGIFSGEECDMYYYCYEGYLYDAYCEADTPIFDYYYLECMTEEEGICLQMVDEGEWDGECPSDPYEVALLPGETCDEYYICLSGWPAPQFCSLGLHFNQITSKCDTPANAQCDPSFAPSPPSLSDCQNMSGVVPHPFDCRQFIFCQKNGSRIVQSCPHLMAFDIDQNQCVIEHQAKCGTAYSKNKIKKY